MSAATDRSTTEAVEKKNRPCPGCRRTPCGHTLHVIRSIKVNRAILDAFCTDCRAWIIKEHYDLLYPKRRRTSDGAFSVADHNM